MSKPRPVADLANLMESFSYQQCNLIVSVGLYTAVRNAAALRGRLISAATMAGSQGESEREALNFAFIDARLVGVLRPHNRGRAHVVANSDYKLTASEDCNLPSYASGYAGRPQNEDRAFRGSLVSESQQQCSLHAMTAYHVHLAHRETR
jgi:hypothetical protein